MQMNEQLLKDQLNDAQFQAVTYCDGPSLVIAGAGSGKTRVLTYKIAWLLSQGVEPWNILSLTFTNKAAREMNGRIAELCAGQDLRGLWSGTFHSIFARILRIEHDYIGYPSDYTIYDTTDVRSLLKAIVKERGCDEKVYKPAILSSRISEAKNLLVLPDEYSRDTRARRRDDADGLGQTYEIYRIYNDRLRAAYAMDFDDLLLNTYLLFKRNPDVLERYKRRFEYILVDEYQDTNKAQYRILSQLTDKDSRICVVGDDAQSIYGFRGADITNILDFKLHYPTARIIKLECNYRSTKQIVEAANSVISNNQGQIPKKIYAVGDKGEPVYVFRAKTDKEEAQKVVARVMHLHAKDLPYNEIALLYRTNAQSRALEEALQGAGIPYRIYGGLSFYQRKEIKDVLAYFRLIVNHRDDEAFRRVINYPARGIGATTLQKLQQAAAVDGVSMWEVAVAPAEHGVKLTSAVSKKISGFCELISSFEESLTKESASSVATDVIRRSGISIDLNKERSSDELARRENVDELLGSILSFEKEMMEEQGVAVVTLPEYLSSVSLLTDVDEQDDDTPRVTLMTVHAAKGLEFEAVFVTGMEDELFPNANASLSPREMEEERRLFYVAITRAKRYCYLSYAMSRFRYGQFQFSEPSPFLSEIDEQYTKCEYRPSSLHAPNGVSSAGSVWNRKKVGADFYRKPLPSQESTAPSTVGQLPVRTSASDSSRSLRSLGKRQIGEAPSAHVTKSTSCQAGTVCVGARINHERFGKGTITEIEGQGSNAKIRVDFDEAGVKNLLVKFAKFEVI